MEGFDFIIFTMIKGKIENPKGNGTEHSSGWGWRKETKKSRNEGDDGRERKRAETLFFLIFLVEKEGSFGK